MFEIHEAKADDDALSDIPDLIDFNGLSEHRTSDVVRHLFRPKLEMDDKKLFYTSTFKKWKTDEK
jgi:hypothetical protein